MDIIWGGIQVNQPLLSWFLLQTHGHMDTTPWTQPLGHNLLFLAFPDSQNYIDTNKHHPCQNTEATLAAETEPKNRFTRTRLRGPGSIGPQPDVCDRPIQRLAETPNQYAQAECTRPARIYGLFWEVKEGSERGRGQTVRQKGMNTCWRFTCLMLTICFMLTV